MKKQQEFLSLIKEDFLSIWTDFLDFEIQRSLRCIKFMGSPNSFIIMQIIFWHQQLILLSEENTINRAKVLKRLLNSSYHLNKSKMKLTYSLVSQLSGLSIETVRRHIKRFTVDKWVVYSKKNGIEFNVNELNMRRFEQELNIHEIELLSKFLSKIELKKI